MKLALHRRNIPTIYVWNYGKASMRERSIYFTKGCMKGMSGKG